MSKDKGDVFTRVLAVAALIVALFGGLPVAYALYEKWDADRALELPVVADIYVSGRFAPGFFMGLNTSEHKYGWTQDTSDGTLRIEYPGDKNGGVWFVTAGKASPEASARKHMDFSAYTKLCLELKGQKGNSIYITVKDRDDLDYGMESRHPITFQSDDWETHTVDLAGFSPVDLEKLNVVACILFGQSPQTIEVRKVQYQ